MAPPEELVMGQSLRFCIPIAQKRMGGMYTFLTYWRHWLDDQGIFVTDNISEEYDILFVNSWAVSASLVGRLKQERLNLRVVQRVDGSAYDYGRDDGSDDKQARVNMFADLTIFQSHYSEYSTRYKFKVIRQPGLVIYNPVDISMYHPEPGRGFPQNSVRVCTVSFSTNRKKGTWQLGELAQANPDIDFILCGHYPPLPSLRNLQLRGYVDHQELAEVIRGCDIFLHLAENDPCPNVVLEALATGLPVAYVDSGGTPELVGDCGLPVTLANFRPQLDLLMNRREELSTAARHRAESQFAPDIVFPQYLEAILQSQRRPLPTWRDYLQYAREGYPVIPLKPKPLFRYVKSWYRETLSPDN